MYRGKEYPEVERLPPSAKSVKEFAAEHGFTIQNLYKMNRIGTLTKNHNVKFVRYKGFNFLVHPNTVTEPVKANV